MSRQGGRWSNKHKSSQRSLWTTPYGTIYLLSMFFSQRESIDERAPVLMHLLLRYPQNMLDWYNVAKRG